jgi:effector-binding domain-containing protein
MKKLRKSYGIETAIRRCIEEYNETSDEKKREEILTELYKNCRRLFSYYYLKEFGYSENFDVLIHRAATDFVIKVMQGKIKKFATKYLETFLLAYTEGGVYFEKEVDNSDSLSLEDGFDIVCVDEDIERVEVRHSFDRLLNKVEEFVEKYNIDNLTRNLIFVSLMTGYSLSSFGLSDIEGIIYRIKNELRNNGGAKNVG